MSHFDFESLLESLSPVLGQSSAVSEKEAQFVHYQYEQLKLCRAFSALVPAEYGGGNAVYSELAHFIRKMAQLNPSTALAFSMHQHLVAAARYNDSLGKTGRKILDIVAQKEVILVSTGANDWLQSNGQVTKIDGGYKVSAAKPFASGAPAAQVMITSAPFEDPEEGWQVLHFPVPLSADGVRMGNDWDTMGMRETGSQTIHLEDVFVSDEAVALKRPQVGYHPAFNVILTVALPLIMSAYVGTAEKIVELSLKKAVKNSADEALPYLLGDMLNQLKTAQVGLNSMLAHTKELTFEVSTELAAEMLTLKTIVANAVLKTGEAALKVSGGSGFFHQSGIEKLLRDLHAAQFHPLPEIRQKRFCGRLALGLEPV